MSFEFRVRVKSIHVKLQDSVCHIVSHRVTGDRLRPAPPLRCHRGVGLGNVSRHGNVSVCAVSRLHGGCTQSVPFSFALQFVAIQNVLSMTTTCLILQYLHLQSNSINDLNSYSSRLTVSYIFWIHSYYIIYDAIYGICLRCKCTFKCTYIYNKNIIHLYITISCHIGVLSCNFCSHYFMHLVLLHHEITHIFWRLHGATRLHGLHGLHVTKISTKMWTLMSLMRFQFGYETSTGFGYETSTNAVWSVSDSV